MPAPEIRSDVAVRMRIRRRFRPGGPLPHDGFRGAPVFISTRRCWAPKPTRRLVASGDSPASRRLRVEAW